MVTVIHSGVVQVNDGALAVWWFWRWHLDDLVVAKLIEAPKASTYCILYILYKVVKIWHTVFLVVISVTQCP